MTEKKCVAMLLAGGQGSRLGSLTEKIAKPAVWYGGKYKIIDFPLSNCINSGIDTVGVLTQYKPLELNDYIGSGKQWDLGRMYGGVHILPPFMSKNGGDFYTGTANAVYQNMEFIDKYNPEYVIILSGDHIYKMDYSKMIEFHKETSADCTIAVIDVDIKEASRFGIMNVTENGRIYEFEEKPKKPKSTLASMGIYVFSYPVLKKFLTLDNNDISSQNDFGRNVIPLMLKSGKNLMSYRFDGYWKDVGTVESFWEANMDLLHYENDIGLYSSDFKIYSANSTFPPQYIADTSKVTNSLITNGCEIMGSVNSSVVFENVRVEKGAVVEHSLLMPNSVVKKGAVIRYCVVAENTVIEENENVGSSFLPNDKTRKITVIENNRLSKKPVRRECV